jgi:hypothetical protein
MMREVHFAVLAVVAGQFIACPLAAQTFELDSTKRGAGVALWIGVGTEAYFANMRLSK